MIQNQNMSQEMVQFPKQPEVIQPQPTQEQEQPQEEMGSQGKANRINKILIVIIVILSISVGVYIYLSKKYQNYSNIVSNIVPSSVPSVTPTPDPTTGWVTYNSKFLIKYPPGWVVKEGNTKPTTVLFSNPLPNSDSLQITIIPSTFPPYVSEYIDKIKSEQNPLLISQFETKTITMNEGKREVYHIGGDGAGWYIPFTFFNTIFVFGPLPDPAADSIQLEMIKTFQFFTTPNQ